MCRGHEAASRAPVPAAGEAGCVRSSTRRPATPAHVSTTAPAASTRAPLADTAVTVPTTAPSTGRTVKRGRHAGTWQEACVGAIENYRFRLMFQ